MAKKYSQLSDSKMLMAACFTLLAVGLYAHVDGWVIRKELATTVLGETTEKQADWPGFWQKVWGRLRYGAKYDQMKEGQRKTAAEQELPLGAVVDRELKNIENELGNDADAEMGSSYWSM